MHDNGQVIVIAVVVYAAEYAADGGIFCLYKSLTYFHVFKVDLFQLHTLN